MKQIRKVKRLLFIQCILAALLFSLPSFSLIADTLSDKRALVGLKLFRTLVGADTGVNGKLDQQGRLPIYLVYASDNNAAKDYANTLADAFPNLRDTPVRLEILSLEALQTATPKPAAIFVTQQLNEGEAKALVAFSIAQHIIVFSPFEGDVERGILAGLSVEATVKPLINMQTLQSSQLAIKSFYLKVAKHYE